MTLPVIAQCQDCGTRRTVEVELDEMDTLGLCQVCGGRRWTVRPLVRPSAGEGWGQAA